MILSKVVISPLLPIYLIHRCDLNDREYFRETISLVADKFGGVDVLVNNASPIDKYKICLATELTFTGDGQSWSGWTKFG
jgi:NAD(P)-dependent dehydrogenase (short-subunit alcohol dehydrogenase family)